jgi:pimeloyl-ACP methyl ester carboxylesterase
MTAHGFVPSSKTSIYYHCEGEGPAVLFIHAGVADARMWESQMDLAGFRTIAFDQRGFGHTEWVAEPYSNRNDALAVLDHLEIDHAVVVGCSNGAEATMQMALVAPSRVSAMVLIGAAPRGWEPEGGWQEEPYWDDLVAAFKAGDYEKVTDYEARLWLAGPGRSLDQIDPSLVSLFKEMDLIPQSTESERNDHVETLEPPTNDQLDRIAAPTLVIVGEHDTPDLQEAARYLAGRLSDRPAVVLEDTAHLPSMDQPMALKTVLEGFLASL